MDYSIFIMLGLILNFIGSFLLAFSFKAGEPIGSQSNDSGQVRDFCLPSFNKIKFRFGIALLCFGFLVQILGYIFN